MLSFQYCAGMEQLDLLKQLVKKRANGQLVVANNRAKKARRKVARSNQANRAFECNEVSRENESFNHYYKFLYHVTLPSV